MTQTKPSATGTPHCDIRIPFTVAIHDGTVVHLEARGFLQPGEPAIDWPEMAQRIGAPDPWEEDYRDAAKRANLIAEALYELGDNSDNPPPENFGNRSLVSHRSIETPSHDRARPLDPCPPSSSSLEVLKYEENEGSWGRAYGVGCSTEFDDQWLAVCVTSWEEPKG